MKAALHWAGLPLARPVVMGILNVTPDSFSDGGDHRDPARAIEVGLQMHEDGAAIIDVGGESTRPGSQPTDPAEERRRVLPVIRGLAQARCLVSIDTRNASTMRTALDAGAAIVNDISALAHDPAAARVVADAKCAVVLMHTRGTPATMHDLAHYDDVATDVARELLDRVRAAEQAGIDPARIALDPGIGFAKTSAQNAALVARLDRLAALGFPLVVGLSRKRVVGDLTRAIAPKDRMPGSIAAGLFALSRGAHILRVHDVAETVQAVRVWDALTRALDEPAGPA
jgi:dihydropteroate synthase